MRAALVLFLLGSVGLLSCGRTCPDKQYLGSDGLCHSPDDASHTGSDGGADDTAGSVNSDADGDGWSEADGDCDDNDAEVHPGAADDTADGVDNDCDGSTDEDVADDAEDEEDVVVYPDGSDGTLWSDDCDDASAADGHVPFDAAIVVPVRVIFVREDDGGGSATQSDVEDALDRTNDAFEPLGISFEVDSVEEVYDSEYATLNGVEFFTLRNMYPTDDTFHMFVVVNGDGFGGIATFAGDSNPAIAVEQDDLVYDDSTTPHEFGHYFGLRHTFQGTSVDSNAEYVDGSNCETAGDNVCDTPADPGEIDDNPESGCDADRDCNLTCGQDSHGDTYEPDVGNLMSYYPEDCHTDQFTDGQALRMLCHARETYSNLTSSSGTTINLNPNDPSVTDSSPDAGDSITVSGTIDNDGTGASGSFTAGLYLSTNSTWSSGDTKLTSWTQSSLSAGSSGSYSEAVTIPSSASGIYYIIVVTDPDDNIAEADETDNTGSRSISVTAAPTTIDLDPNNPSVTDSSPDAGDSITVSGTIDNDGTGASGSFTAGLYLSTNSTWSSGDTKLTSWTQSSLSAGSSGSYSEAVTIPSSASGSYYIIVVTDPDDNIAEADETDNTGSRSISVTATCSETDYWSPDSMTSSDTEAGTTLEVEIQDAGSGGDLEFRVCKGSGTFSNDIHVDFEEWVRYSGYGIFSDDISTKGAACSSWETLSTSSWSDGDGFGGDIQIVSPDYCDSTWGWSCSGSSACGTCWFISTSIMYRTCL